MEYIDLLEDLKPILKSELQSLSFDGDDLTDLQYLLIRYFNAIRRRPPIVKWQIEESRLIKSKRINEEIEQGLVSFKNKAINGEDLMPFTSKKTKKRADYYDLLLNDWGIMHFHLARRKGNLLFAMPRQDEQKMYLIDILSHDDFSNQNLLNIIDENWPYLLEPYIAEWETAPKTSNNQIKILRSKNCMTFIKTKSGKVLYPIGGGYTAGGMNTFDIRNSDVITTRLKELQKHILKNKDEFKKSCGIDDSIVARIRLQSIESLDNDSITVTLLEEKTKITIRTSF